MSTEIRTRRTKLSFEEFKAQTTRFLKSQGASLPRQCGRRQLSTGKVAKVVSGGSRSSSSDESDTEESIRKIILQRQNSNCQRVDEASQSREASRSDDSTHAPELQESMQRLQEQEKQLRTQKQQDRKEVFMQVIAQLSGDKSCSLSLSGDKSVSSGSETEKPGDVGEKAARLLVAVESKVDDKALRRDFRRVIKDNHELRLLLYLCAGVISGVFACESCQLRRIHSTNAMPDRVSTSRIQGFFKLISGDWKPASSLKSADSFTL